MHLNRYADEMNPAQTGHLKNVTKVETRPNSFIATINHMQMKSLNHLNFRIHLLPITTKQPLGKLPLLTF